MKTTIRRQIFVGIDAMPKFFDGCVYIQDLDAIMVPNGNILDMGKFNAKYEDAVFAMDNDHRQITKKAWEAFLNNTFITFPRVDATVDLEDQPFQSVHSIANKSYVNTHKRQIVVTEFKPT